MEDEPISIKVIIGGRPYPLRISWKNEEQVRKAAKLINEKLEKYMDKVAYRDYQDLLAIVALDYAIDSLKLEHKAVDDKSELSNIIAHIELLLKNH